MFRLRGCYPLRQNFPDLFDYIRQCHLVVLNPMYKYMVWALSRSLAATWKIDVSFSSSGYLDVSVPRVTFSVTILFTTG